MISEHGAEVGIAALCKAFGEPRASWYRTRRPRIVCAEPRQSARRLSQVEEHQVLETLNSGRFRDMAPGEIYAILLDEDRYLCSERTMYRTEVYKLANCKSIRCTSSKEQGGFGREYIRVSV